MARYWCRRSFEAIRRAGEAHRITARWVEHEFWPVDHSVDLANIGRDTLHRLRKRRRGDRQLARVRVHFNLRSDDFGAEVERARDYRHRDRQAERSALIRSRQVDRRCWSTGL